jgi:phage terminase small subunit
MNIKPPLFVRTREQKKYFKAVLTELNENNIELKSIDTFALGTLAINLALIDESMISLAKDGAVMESATEKGTTRKKNPSLDLLRDAQLAVRAYYKEFQMSPNSRANNGYSLPSSPLNNPDGISSIRVNSRN